MNMVFRSLSLSVVLISSALAGIQIPDPKDPTKSVEVDRAGVIVLHRRVPDASADWGVLLLESSKHNHVVNFPAGIVDPKDRSSMAAAIREAREETGGVLNLTEADLAHAPFIYNKRTKHQLFILRHEDPKLMENLDRVLAANLKNPKLPAHLKETKKAWWVWSQQFLDKMAERRQLASVVGGDKGLNFSESHPGMRALRQFMGEETNTVPHFDLMLESHYADTAAREIGDLRKKIAVVLNSPAPVKPAPAAAKPAPVSVKPAPILSDADKALLAAQKAKAEAQKLVAAAAKAQAEANKALAAAAKAEAEAKKALAAVPKGVTPVKK